MRHSTNKTCRSKECHKGVVGEIRYKTGWWAYCHDCYTYLNMWVVGERMALLSEWRAPGHQVFIGERTALSDSDKSMALLAGCLFEPDDTTVDPVRDRDCNDYIYHVLLSEAQQRYRADEIRRRVAALEASPARTNHHWDPYGDD